MTLFKVIIDYVGRRKLIEKCSNCGETGEE
jgi:hypothetical protein